MVYILTVLIDNNNSSFILFSCGSETSNVSRWVGFGTEDWRLWCGASDVFSASASEIVSNCAVGAQSGCTPVSTLVRQRRLLLFGHIVRSHPMLDHHMWWYTAVLYVQRSPASWRRPKGRPRLTWTRVIECGLCPTVAGLHSTWHRARHRSDWRSLVETATLHTLVLYWWWWWWWMAMICSNVYTVIQYTQKIKRVF